MNRNTPIELSEAEALDALRQVLREERKAYWDAQAKTKNGLKSDPFRRLVAFVLMGAETKDGGISLPWTLGWLAALAISARLLDRMGAFNNN